MTNVAKVLCGLAAVFFVLLAFGPGGFLVDENGGRSSGVGTIGIAEEFKARQGGNEGSSNKGVADKRFQDAPGETAQNGESEDSNAGAKEYDFFGTLARVFGLGD